MTTNAGKFWQEMERYHDLAEMYERNIEVTHPGSVSTDRFCRLGNYCIWHRTAVVYREYRGPRPQS